MLTTMHSIKTIIKLLGDFVTFMWLIVRPRDTLAGENLFLRKQLAMYQEREQKPRRPDTPLRIALVLFCPGYSIGRMHWWLSSLRLWSDGTVRAFDYSGAGSRVQGDLQYQRNFVHSSMKWL